MYIVLVLFHLIFGLIWIILQVYIVYFGEHDVGEKALDKIEETHHSYLYSVKDTTKEEARASLLYSYKHSINGFAAMLSPDEASRLSGERKNHAHHIHKILLCIIGFNMLVFLIYKCWN